MGTVSLDCGHMGNEEIVLCALLVANSAWKNRGWDWVAAGLQTSGALEH